MATAASLPLRIAFYLPQFYKTPENDAWHGPGFTEWSAVAKSRPHFPGHYQPDLPGELGFYDLRLPETRELQTRLARSHGISGFCYYHYWFKGQRMLERPFNEVLRTGKPNFPFCLCWANESWYRRWQGSIDEMVVRQEFDEDDDVEHIRWLIEAFRDERYIRVNGRPLLTIYRPADLPNPLRTVEIWRRECNQAGLPEPWIVGFETDTATIDPADIGFDATAEFVPHGLSALLAPQDPPAHCDPSNTVYDYSSVADAYTSRPSVPWIRYPCVATGWDNSPRRQSGEALILRNSTPEAYGEWLRRALGSQTELQGSNGIVFINAWNEWAEGAHLEPDARFGRAYLEMTEQVVGPSAGDSAVGSPSATGSDHPGHPAIEDIYEDLYERFVELQDRASGYLAAADRQTRSVREFYERELAKRSEENRELAEWCLAMERQLALATDQLEAIGAGADPGAGTSGPRRA